MRTLVVPLISGAVALVAACGGSAFSNGDDTGGAPTGAGGSAQGGSAVAGSGAGGALGQGGASMSGGLTAGGAVSAEGGGTTKGGTSAQGGSTTTQGGAVSQGGAASSGSSGKGGATRGGNSGKGGATQGGNSGKGGAAAQGGTGKGGTPAQGGTLTSGGAIVSGGVISVSGAGGVPSVGGVGGVPSVGGAGGASGGVCRQDTDCHISTDCCSCFAAGPGEATTLCKSVCKQTACAAAGVADSEVACVAGRCVIARSCTLTAVTCDALPPTCEAGQLPSLLNGCYGPCLAVGECSDVPSCKSCEEVGLKCVTIQAQAAPRYHCVSTPPACEKNSTCSCMSVCLRPYQCNAPESTDLTCGCPTC